MGRDIFDIWWQKSNHIITLEWSENSSPLANCYSEEIEIDKEDFWEYLDDFIDEEEYSTEELFHLFNKVEGIYQEDDNIVQNLLEKLYEEQLKKLENAEASYWESRFEDQKF